MSGNFVSRNVARVAIHPVAWLWASRIPLGMVTILDGDPGLGKSTITANIAALVSRGHPMPLEDCVACNGEPANVLMLSAEDSVEHTIKPRLMAAGADCERVIMLESVTAQTQVGGSIRLDQRPGSLPGDIDILQAEVRRHAARLVIIDPLMAYLDSAINSFRDQDVRRAMMPLKTLAEQTGAAVLCVRHLNKMAGGSAIYRGGGSIGVIGAARSGLMVGRDPNDEGAFILAQTKSNVAELADSLRYRIESAAVEGVATSRVAWLGTSDSSADQLVQQEARPRGRPPTGVAERCADAIREILDGGIWHNVAVLNQALSDRGFTDWAIRRGKAIARTETRTLEFGGAREIRIAEAVQRGSDVLPFPPQS